ncbi:hypothetical protein R2F61_03920 [Mollicutes bacterium LVI A0078]|nr:hypothetical protein RZE84_03945 [Mollicutes bacterium LVI A0075]WOO91710.1 hypothetical protein R2F61_03920 [Mollicutes bacterium LVI A0078]
MAILMLWIRPRGIRGILMLVSTLVSFAISMYTLYHGKKIVKYIINYVKKLR